MNRCPVVELCRRPMIAWYPSDSYHARAFSSDGNSPTIVRKCGIEPSRTSASFAARILPPYPFVVSNIFEAYS